MVDFRDGQPFGKAFKQDRSVWAVLAQPIHSDLSLSGGIKDSDIGLPSKLKRSALKRIPLEDSASLDFRTEEGGDDDDENLLGLPAFEKNSNHSFQAQETLFEKPSWTSSLWRR